MLELFLASSTQWRFAGMDGVPTGLDYAGVSAAAKALFKRPLKRALFEDLRVMELAALEAMIERRKH